MNASIIGSCQVVEFLPAVLAGRSRHRLVVKAARDLAVGAVQFRKNSIRAREQKIILTVDSVIDTRVVEQVPQINRRHHRRDRAEWVAFPTIRIADVAHPLSERAGVAAGGKGVAEHTDFTVYEKIVERDKFARELMLDRRDVLAK